MVFKATEKLVVFTEPWLFTEKWASGGESKSTGMLPHTFAKSLLCVRLDVGITEVV